MKLFIMNFPKLCSMILAISALFIPAMGNMQTISPGGTVFLGEEGLDITASGISDGGQIGWWAPGSPRASEPTELVSVSSPESFYVAPSTFSTKEGLWYTWPANTPVFQVKSPQISMRVHDETADFDATGKWIPRGDVVSFEISSNVYEANSRGGSEGQVDIVLTSPEGADHDSVSGPAGSYSLSGIPLTSSLTSTGPVWSTGGVDVGTWVVQGEISMNQIKNNLPDLGAGVSIPVEILIQNVNPLIKSPVAIEIGTPAPEKTPTVTKTGVPTYTVPVTEPPTLQTQVKTPVSTSTLLPTPTDTAIQTIEPTPVKTPESTPIPAPTQSPPGLLPILGAVMLFVWFRRT